MKKLINPLIFCASMFFLGACDKDDDMSPGDSDVVLIATTVKVEIGGVLYENVDALLRAKGYDASNAVQWTKDYEFTGPHDTLEIKNGLHHYSLELVDKWGINDIQADILAKDLWAGRVGGPMPVTYGLGGAKEAKKLASYVSYALDIDFDSQPSTRTSYEYNEAGQLRVVRHANYNPETEQFQTMDADSFVYENNLLSKIMYVVNGEATVKYEYKYGVDDKVIYSIVDEDGNPLLFTRTSTKDNTGGKVNALYSISNGNSYSYQFDVLYKNIVSDKTQQSGQVCNEGTYQYDKNINPFRHLGYVDFNYLNLSINNELKDNVEYKACSFPGAIPDFYSYEYDNEGYPTKKITTYKTNGEGLASHTEIRFYYE